LIQTDLGVQNLNSYLKFLYFNHKKVIVNNFEDVFVRYYPYKKVRGLIISFNKLSIFVPKKRSEELNRNENLNEICGTYLLNNIVENLMIMVEIEKDSTCKNFD